MGPNCGLSTRWATLPCGLLSPTTCRILAGDWLGEVRLWDAADGKPVATLPANPPTLAMLVESETAKFAAATKSLEQATGELTLAQAGLDEKTKALGAAVDAAAAALAVAQKGTADQAAAKALLDTKEAEEKAATEQLSKAKAAAAAAAAGGDQATLNAAVAAVETELAKIAADKAPVAKSVADWCLPPKPPPRASCCLAGGRHGCHCRQGRGRASRRRQGRGSQSRHGSRGSSPSGAIAQSPKKQPTTRPKRLPLRRPRRTNGHFGKRFLIVLMSATALTLCETTARNHGRGSYMPWSKSFVG